VREEPSWGRRAASQPLVALAIAHRRPVTLVSLDEAPLPQPEGPAAQVRSPAEAPTRTHPGPPSRRVRNLVIATLVSMVIAGYVATGFLSFLLTEHPLVFIGLSSSNRNLALASADLSAWSFYAVAFLRLLAPDPFFFLLGRWYGDGATRWMERKSPSYGQLLRQLERWFEKARYLVVVIAPNNPVCLFAGASTMTWASFLAANVVGTAGRLVLIRLFSSAFDNPLGIVRDFIGEYQRPLLVVSLALVAFSIWSERRGGRDSIGDLVHLPDDISKAESSASSPAGAPGARTTPEPAEEE